MAYQEQEQGCSEEKASEVLKLQEVSDLEGKIESLEQKITHINNIYKMDLEKKEQEKKSLEEKQEQKITRMNDIYKMDLEKEEQEKKSLEEKLKGKTTLTKYFQALFKKTQNVLNTLQALFDNHASKLAEYEKTNNANLKIIYESQETILKLEENTARLTKLLTLEKQLSKSAKEQCQSECNSAPWDGTYTLVSYDASYESYLKSMGIPSYLVPLILVGSETLQIKVTESGAEIITVTDWNKRDLKFEFNKEFNMTYGLGRGTMHSICERPRNNVVFCKSEEREKKWTLSSHMEFSQRGMVNERIFVNKNIGAKKYYQKEGAEQEESFPVVTEKEIDIFTEEDSEE